METNRSMKAEGSVEHMRPGIPALGPLHKSQRERWSWSRHPLWAFWVFFVVVVVLFLIFF